MSATHHTYLATCAATGKRSYTDRSDAKAVARRQPAQGLPAVTATTRTRPLTPRQQAALAFLTDKAEGTYLACGSWVPVCTLFGHRRALAQLVDRGLVETTQAAGPLGNVRPVYRPRAASAPDNLREAL